jgi:integrase
VTPPKTALSRRTLPLARAEVALLTELRATQLAERELAGPEWSDEDFVFTTETGRPMDPRNVLRALTTAASKAGLSGVNVHTLRHSAATAWIEAGVNIKAVSTLLGHADIRITADVYGHVSDAVARAAMETLSGILRA